MRGLDRSLDFDHLDPAGLAYLNIALAGGDPGRPGWSPGSLHGLRPRWLASVAPRIRWRCLLVCFGLSVRRAVRDAGRVAMLLPAAAAATELVGELNDFTARTRDFLLVVLLLTPLQAAGEEYAFRGYLTQAFGGLFGQALGRSRCSFPALLFALAHGMPGRCRSSSTGSRSASSPASWSSCTGGLEAGIAMHVLNNWLAFGLALAFGDMASRSTRPAAAGGRSR